MLATLAAHALDAFEASPEHPAEILWRGQSGKDYQYFVEPIGIVLEKGGYEPSPVNFIFVRETKPNMFVPIYASETENLALVLDDHHTMRRMQFNRVTHICVRPSGNDPAARQAEKQDIAIYWQPTCNK